MAMKKKLTKAEFDKLSDLLKAEYIADGDGYKLDLTDDEDTGALKRALERERESASTSKARLAEVEKELESLNSSDARKRGDIATLEKAWQKKHDETETTYKARVEKLTSFANKTLIETNALALATKISTVPALMSKAIRERLTVDFEGDVPTLKILDTTGKPSALTMEQLQEEFKANKDYANIIIGSKATGGGAAPNKPGFNRPGGADNEKPVILSSLKPNELAAAIKAKKEQSTE